MASSAVRVIRDPGLLTGQQRSAILVMYLSDDVARMVLSNLSGHELQQMGLAMAEVEQVDPAVIEAVIADFVRDLHDVAMVPKTGEDYALNVLPGLIDERRRPRVVGALRRKLSSAFEEFIAARPPRTIATILQDEHPQAQAVALLLMGADCAASVMAQFEPRHQVMLASRMASITQIPGELADDVEDALRQAMVDHGAERFDVEGIDRTARILGRLPAKEQDRVLDEIASDNRDLAETLRRRMIVFDDVCRLADRDIQTLLKNAQRDVLALALRGADATALDGFLRNMSSRAAEDLRDDIELMGPQSRSRVDEAREELVQIAVRLRDDGLVELGTGGGDML